MSRWLVGGVALAGAVAAAPVASIAVVPAERIGLSAPPARQPARRALFIGNSLTAAHDLPAMVSALSVAGGGPAIETQAVTHANFSLGDHWHQGDARRAITTGGWTWVILQQGPSALPASQEHLRDFARRFAADIRRAGAQPALYMVWPSRARAFDFAGVSESYRRAAEDVRGTLLPAGDAWREAWKLAPNLDLYGPDAFHPGPAGSYLAALVIHQGLSGRTPPGLPAALVSGSGVTLVSLDREVARTLQRAAAAVAPASGRLSVSPDPYTKKDPDASRHPGLREIIPAATYSPTQLPMQYHRR